VVGVVSEVKLDAIDEGARTVGSYYFPYAQRPTASRGITFAVKSAGDPRSSSNALRAAINDLDRELPVFDLQTMEERMEKALVTRRSPMVLSLSFGLVALLLSAIGIYGVLAYLVTQRTKEIGIRIALGSSARAIFELVLREGLLVIGAGFVLGAAGTAALRKSLESQLFGVRATDPVVLATVTAVLALVALAACVLPARRATKIDPIVALTE
jgi:putative ABC transport system permease protein